MEAVSTAAVIFKDIPCILSIGDQVHITTSRHMVPSFRLLSIQQNIRFATFSYPKPFIAPVNL